MANKCIDCGGPVAAGDNCCEVCFNRPKAQPVAIETVLPQHAHMRCVQCGKVEYWGHAGMKLCQSCWKAHSAVALYTKAKHCYYCGTSFNAHSNALYCSGACRVAAHREGKQAPPKSKAPIDIRTKVPLVPKHPPLLKLRFQILERDKFACTYCGRSADTGAELQIDHIHPESKEGEWVESNLTTACRECNIGKGDRILTFRKPSLQSVSQA